MMLLEAMLTLSTLLCSLVAGFVFAFAAVAMPGIRRLGDREFLQAFRAMDRVIQDNQPLFLSVWVGSVGALVMATLLGLWRLDGLDRLLIAAAAVFYLLGVQLPTAAVNVPLNNRLQAQDLDALSGPMLQQVRREFEAPWTKWNSIRTVFATLTSLSLMTLLLRL